MSIDILPKVGTDHGLLTGLSDADHSSLGDSDADTKIQVEESSDEDIIRFDAEGIERVTIAKEEGVDIFYIATTNDEHALEIIVDAAGFGDVKAIDIDYDTGAIAAGEDEAVNLVNINEIDALGGDVFGLEVLSTDGSASIYGMKVGAVVGPILQESGAFANPTTGTNDTPSTDVAAMIDGSTGTNTTIFVADNDYILIGAAAAFTEIEFIIETPAANPGIKPTFGYSTAGSHLFTTFSPVDGTNGFRNTGVISWDAADLTNHAVNTDTGTFDIKIIRTHGTAGSVSLFYAKTAATIVYSWNKEGDLLIRSIYQREQASANADTAGRGQLWVKDDTPNNIYFTDDAGNDRQLAYAGGAFHDGFSDFAGGEHFLQSAITTVGTVTTGNVDAVVSNANTTTKGKVELATAAEVTTGTDATRAVTPDGLAGSEFGERVLQIVVIDFTTDLATGDGKFYFHIDSRLAGMNLVDVHAEVITAGTTNTTDIQLRNVTQTADILSTKLTIDSGETGSDTAATPAVIDGAEDDVQENDIIAIDIDAISTTAPKGLIITLGFRLP